MPKNSPKCFGVAKSSDESGQNICRVENDFDAHRAPLQEDQSAVAAVYDCRIDFFNYWQNHGQQNHEVKNINQMAW